MKTISFAALLCAASLFLPCAYTQQTEEQSAQFQATKTRAEQGDARAQLSMGYYYRDGRGVEKDPLEEIKWYRKAAEQNYVPAQVQLALHSGGEERIKWLRKAADQNSAQAKYELGYCYETGNHVTSKDVAEAVKWYRRAAEQDYFQAQSRLGFLYEYGRGVEKDYSEAVKWYRIIAEYNHSEGQRSLSRCYALGYGVEKNEVEAYAWKILAANGVYVDFAKERDEFAKKLTPEQLAEGSKRAAELRPQVLAGAEKRYKAQMAAANAELRAANEVADRKKASEDAKKASDAAAARALIPLPARSERIFTMEDFFGLIGQGSQLTPENAAKLETKLKKDPKDIWARLLLIGYNKKGNKMPPECAELLLGLVEHHPREPGTGGIYIILSFLYDRSTLQQAVALWEKHVAAMPKDAQVLGNAALWMMHGAAVDPKYAKESRSLFEKARALDPKNPAWAEYVGGFLLAEAHTLQPPQRIAVAKQAIEHIEAAHRLRDEKSRATYQMMGGQNHLSLLADASFLTGETNKAKAYLIEMLQTKETKDWNYGNMVYYNNSKLGQIALSEGKPDEAAKYLLAAGKTPGSPQLNSFGPSFALAKELLQLGRPQDRATVVKFLDDVASFWADPDKSANYKEMKIKNREAIEAWKKEITDGKIPTGPKW